MILKHYCRAIFWSIFWGCFEASNALFFWYYFSFQAGAKDGPVNSNTWISNLLPAPKSEDQQSQKDGQESLSSQQTSKETSPVNTPVHLRQSEQNMHAHQSPQKPLNLLPEVPETANSAGRKFSEREKRDCEVIGKIKSYFLWFFQNCISILEV